MTIRLFFPVFCGGQAPDLTLNTDSDIDLSDFKMERNGLAHDTIFKNHGNGYYSFTISKPGYFSMWIEDEKVMENFKISENNFRR